MNATIIIRKISNNSIKSLVQLPDLSESTFQGTLKDLKAQFPADSYRIDSSQVYWARKAAAEREAA